MELGAKDIWTTSAIAPAGCSVMCVIVGDHLTSFRDKNGLVTENFLVDRVPQTVVLIYYSNVSGKELF